MEHRIVELYLADLKRRDEKANKIINAVSYLNKFYDWCEEQSIHRYQRITKDHIIDFRHYLINDYRTKQGKPLANNSINAILTHVVNHFDWLKETGRRRDNPTKDLPINLHLDKNTSEEDIKYIEPHEINQLKEYFRTKKHGPESVLLTRFTFEEGLRIGEALALDLDNIDLKNRKVRIAKTLARNGRIQRTPKSKKSNRIIHVPQSLIDDIRVYIKNHRSKKSKTEALFTCNGGRVSYTTAEPRIKVASKELNFRVPLTWHVGRHSAATNMLAAGMDIYSVQRHLGHEKLETTEKYLHLIESKGKQYAKLRDNYTQNGNGLEKTNKFSQLKELFSGLSKEEKLQLLAEVIG